MYNGNLFWKANASCCAEFEGVLFVLWAHTITHAINKLFYTPDAIRHFWWPRAKFFISFLISSVDLCVVRGVAARRKHQTVEIPSPPRWMRALPCTIQHFNAFLTILNKKCCCWLTHAIKILVLLIDQLSCAKSIYSVHWTFIPNSREIRFSIHFDSMRARWLSSHQFDRSCSWDLCSVRKIKGGTHTTHVSKFHVRYICICIYRQIINDEWWWLVNLCVFI